MATEKFIDTFGLFLELSLQEIKKDYKIDVQKIKKEILGQFEACIRGERERIYYDKFFPLEEGGRLYYDCELLSLSGSNEGRKILEKIQLAQDCLSATHEFGGEEEKIPQKEKEIHDELKVDIEKIIFHNRADNMLNFFMNDYSWKTLKKDIYDKKDTTHSSKTIDTFLYNDKEVDFLLGNTLLRSSFKVEK